MIVEDDQKLYDELAQGLHKWNFSVVSASGFENVLEDFVKLKPHLVIMDVNLPYFDGFYWCRKIRDISRTPILFLSSRDDNMDIVMAVNTGADDYITKPFSMQVLIAKIQAILRRAYDYSAGASALIEHKGIILNVDEGTVLFNGEKIELTRNELRILTLLFNNKGRVVSRESLMQQLWNDDLFVNENTLTVNVNRLRNKLSGIGLPELINTKKGQGYIIV